MLAGQLQSFFDRPRNYRSVTDLDDRSLDQVRVGDHCLDHLGVRCVIAQPRPCGTAGCLDRPQSSFCDQSRQTFFGKGFFEIIDLVVIYAVFTKQRRNVAAGSSGRFFINGYLFAHIYLIPIFWYTSSRVSLATARALSAPFLSKAASVSSSNSFTRS